VNWCFIETKKDYRITKAKLVKHGLCTKASWLTFQVEIANNNLAWNKQQLVTIHACHGKKIQLRSGGHGISLPNKLIVFSIFCFQFWVFA
jgi:hypothetical protein